MYRFWIILCFVMLHGPLVANNDYMQLYHAANAYYNQARYDSAIALYEQLAAKELKSADVHFNLGNAYFRTNKIAASILNYERAKLLAPGREDIAYNLQLANNRVALRIDAIPELIFVNWFKLVARSLHSDGWAWIALGLFWIFLGALSFFVFSPRLTLRKLAFALAFISLVGSVATWWLSYTHKQELISHSHAIVFDESMTAKSTPDMRGTSLFQVSEGIKVKIQQTSGEWVEIRLAGGQVGWLPASSIIII